MITLIQCDTAEEALAFFNQRKGQWLNAIQFNKLLVEKGYKPIHTTGAKKNFCDKFDFRYEKKGKQWRFLVDELPENRPNKSPNKSNLQILGEIAGSCSFGSLEEISVPLKEMDTAVFVPKFSKTVPIKTHK